MVWTGNIRVSQQINAGYVEVGSTMAPARVDLAMKGFNGEPDLRMTFVVRDGRPECIGVYVEAKPDGRGIRSADLQVLNLDVLTESAIAKYSLPIVENLPPGSHELSDRDREAALRDVHRARRERRGSVTLAELERVAEVYREHPEAPTKHVEILLGYERRTAARRVQMARARGLLPATTRGKKKA